MTPLAQNSTTILMSDTLTNLNLLVDLDTFGAAMGLDLWADPESYPVYRDCPMGQHRMIMYKHNLDGPWFYCPSCNFYGDAIELVSAAKRLPFYDATMYMAERNAFVIPKDQVMQRWQIQLDYFLNTRLTINTFWETAKNKLIHEQCPEWRSLLIRQGLNIKYMNRVDWYTGIGTMIGGVTREMVENTLVTRTGRRYRVGRWKYAITFPWYELPGKICAVQIVEERGSFPWSLEGYRTGRPTEGGLMVLGRIDPMPEDTLYVFREPMAALEFERNLMQCTSKPANIVVWNHQTRMAWNMVQAQRIIFWSSRLDPELFRQASLIHGQDVHVSVYGPRIGTDLETLCSLWKKETPNSVLAGIEETAKPISVAYDEWLSTLDNDERGSALRMFDPHEIPGMSDPKNSRAYIIDYLGLAASKRTEINGKLVTEQNDRWWVFNRITGTRELISDAVIRIDYITMYENARGTMFSGVVIYNGEEIPFSEPAGNTIEKKTEAWLKDFLASKKGRGYPDIHPAWGHYLFAIALRLSRPRQVRGTSRVGWDGRQSYVLPRIRITDGKIFKDSPFSPKSEGPLGKLVEEGLDIEDIVERHRFEELSALAIPFLYNCIARMLGRPHLKTAVVSKNPDILAMLLSEQMDYPLLSLGKRDADYRSLSSYGLLHDIPRVFVVGNYGPRNFIQWSDKVGDVNCLGFLNETLVRAASINSDWAVVRVDGTTEPKWMMQTLVQMIPHYIAFVQRLKSKPLGVYNAAEKLFYSWIAEMYNVHPGIVEKTKRLISQYSIEEEERPEVRFLNFVFYLLQHRRIFMQHVGDSDRAYTVEIDDRRDKVIIHRRRLLSCLSSKMGIPTLKIPSGEILHDDGIILEVDKNMWEECSKKFLSRQAAENLGS